MRIQSTVAGAVLALAAVAQRSTVGTGTVPPEIRFILQGHCTVCHSAGGPSPMPLVTEEEMLRWAQPIKEQALGRRMPIWHAARGYGAFSNDPSLTPHELDLIVRWADASSAPTAPAAPAAPAPSAPPARSAPSARLAPDLTVQVRDRWVTGWTFVPGDPLIVSATFTSADGATIGAWTAGDRPVRLPDGSAIRVVSPIRVEIRRRDATSYETAFRPRESVLRFTRLPPTKDQSPPVPSRRIRIEHVACGGTIGPLDATLIGVRPSLAPGASAHVTVERIAGAQPVLLGWFRDFDPNYPRIYWLDRPLDFVADARLTGDAPCDMDLVLSSRR